jgi:hypothetical protein
MVTWEEFEEASISDWISKVNTDLKGKGRAEDLFYIADQHIKVSPFIGRDNNQPVADLRGIFTKSGVLISSGTAAEMNTKALRMLENGAQVLHFEIDADADFSLLFSGIFIDMIDIFLTVTGDRTVAERKFTAYIRQHYSDKTSSVVLISDSSENVLRLGANVSFTGRMTQVRDFLALQERRKHTTEILIYSELKTDFLTQVAELRAVRLLGKRTLNSSDYQQLTIIGVLNPEVFSKATVNPLIEINYMILSAYLGMCDVVFGIPAGNDEELARLSLNIQHIIQDESRIRVVNDPVAGSYLIEKITSELLGYV